MNGTTNIIVSTTTGVEKVKDIRSDVSQRQEICVNCGEQFLDNWIMRHIVKCVDQHPRASELYEQQSENHEAFKKALFASRKERLGNANIQKVEKVVSPEQPVVLTASETNTLDKKLVEPTPVDKRLLNNFQKYTFKFGDLVDAVVTSIESYGVHVNNINGNLEKQGLIKISKARNSTVTDLKQFFRIGDKIRAEVVEVRIDGKLGLSTRKSTLPNYGLSPSEPTYKNTSLGDKLEPLKEQIMGNNEIALKDDKQLEEVLAFVKSKVGVVSPEAKAKIKGMLDTKGMFSFMMALAKAADIQMDVGLVFASEIERQMGNRP